MPNNKSHFCFMNTNSKGEQILRGAMQVFLQQGYVGTSMDRVATAAGVSKNTIYNHFQDKEGLFTALIEQVAIDRFQISFNSVSLSGKPAVVLHQVAEKILTTIVSDREYISFLRLLIGESERFPQLAKLFIKTLPQPVLSILSQYLQSHPELKLSSAEETALIFINSIVGYVLIQEILPGKSIIPQSQAEFVENLVNLIIKKNKVA